MSTKGIINCSVNKDVNTIIKSIIMFGCVYFAWWTLVSISQLRTIKASFRAFNLPL